MPVGQSGGQTERAPRCIHYNGRSSPTEIALLHQRYKNIAFWGISKAALPNHFVQRLRWRLRSPQRAVHLHLGCGTKYLKGFLNVDANPFTKIDLWLDARNGLPFPSNSADSI